MAKLEDDEEQYSNELDRFAQYHNDNEIITPIEAVECIWRSAGSRYQARLLIADAIHKSEVLVYTNEMAELESFDPQDDVAALIEKGKSHSNDDGSLFYVHPDYWEASSAWPEETRHWDWKTGDFFIDMAGDTPGCLSGYVIKGARFKRAQILAIMDETSRKGVGGRPLDRAQWSKMWVFFFKALLEENRDVTSFPSKTALAEYMLHHADWQGAEYSTIKVGVDLAWANLVKGLKCKDNI